MRVYTLVTSLSDSEETGLPSSSKYITSLNYPPPLLLIRTSPRTPIRRRTPPPMRPYQSAQ